MEVKLRLDATALRRNRRERQRDMAMNENDRGRRRAVSYRNRIADRAKAVLRLYRLLQRMMSALLRVPVRHLHAADDRNR